MKEKTKLYRYEFQDLYNDDGYVHRGFLIAESDEEAVSIVSAEKNIDKQYVKVFEARLIELN